MTEPNERDLPTVVLGAAVIALHDRECADRCHYRVCDPMWGASTLTPTAAAASVAAVRALANHEGGARRDDLLHLAREIEVKATEVST